MQPPTRSARTTSRESGRLLVTGTDTGSGCAGADPHAARSACRGARAPRSGALPQPATG